MSTSIHSIWFFKIGTTKLFQQRIWLHKNHHHKPNLTHQIVSKNSHFWSFFGGLWGYFLGHFSSFLRWFEHCFWGHFGVKNMLFLGAKIGSFWGSFSYCFLEGELSCFGGQKSTPKVDCWPGPKIRLFWGSKMSIKMRLKMASKWPQNQRKNWGQKCAKMRKMAKTARKRTGTNGLSAIFRTEISL